jgi:GT2 family glycosyltransferase
MMVNETVTMRGDAANAAPADAAADVGLTIIVVSFNTREMTLDCLRSIYQQTRDQTFEVIVVDNDSSDGSAEAIAAEFPAIKLIASKRNLGFALANNVAAEHASGRRILLLNPDTVVIDRAIDRLVAFADAHPSHRIWGGRTLFADGSLNRSSCWGNVTLWSMVCFAFGLAYMIPNSQIFSPEAYGGWKRDTVRNVDIVTGCFLLIDREMWQRLQGFDPLFFMYGEEADLCRRAARMGARPTITPSATIIHYGSASDVVAVEKRVKVFKARVTLIDRHLPPYSRGIAKALHVLGPWLRWRAYGLASRVFARASLTDQAAYWREVYVRRNEWMHGYSV